MAHRRKPCPPLVYRYTYDGQEYYATSSQYQRSQPEAIGAVVQLWVNPAEPSMVEAKSLQDLVTNLFVVFGGTLLVLILYIFNPKILIKRMFFRVVRDLVRTSTQDRSR